MRRFLVVCGLVLFSAAAAAVEPAASPREIRPLLIGAEVPQLVLRTGDGGEFDLNAAISEKPTILLFYRGGW